MTNEQIEIAKLRHKVEILTDCIKFLLSGETDSEFANELYDKIVSAEFYNPQSYRESEGEA